MKLYTPPKTATARAFGILLAFIPGLAQASTASSGMPWEEPLDVIASSLQGPTLAAVLIFGIIGCCVAFAMREAATGFRWFVGIVGAAAIGAAGLSTLNTMGITTSLI